MEVSRSCGRSRVPVVTTALATCAFRCRSINLTYLLTCLLTVSLKETGFFLRQNSTEYYSLTRCDEMLLGENFSVGDGRQQSLTSAYLQSPTSLPFLILFQTQTSLGNPMSHCQKPSRFYSLAHFNVFLLHKGLLIGRFRANLRVGRLLSGRVDLRGREFESQPLLLYIKVQSVFRPLRRVGQ